MGKRNKHFKTAEDYLQSFLGGYIQCPKNGCPGRLIPVLVQYPPSPTSLEENSKNNLSYEQHRAPITEELECTCCGRVVRNENLLARMKAGENIFNKNQSCFPSKNRKRRGQQHDKRR